MQSCDDRGVVGGAPEADPGKGVERSIRAIRGIPGERAHETAVDSIHGETSIIGSDLELVLQYGHKRFSSNSCLNVGQHEVNDLGLGPIRGQTNVHVVRPPSGIGS